MRPTKRQREAVQRERLRLSMAYANVELGLECDEYMEHVWDYQIYLLENHTSTYVRREAAKIGMKV